MIFLFLFFVSFSTVLFLRAVRFLDSVVEICHAEKKKSNQNEKKRKFTEEQSKKIKKKANDKFFFQSSNTEINITDSSDVKKEHMEDKNDNENENKNENENATHKKVESKNDDDNDDEIDILSRLIKSYQKDFLETHVRTALLATGEMHSLAAFSVTRILLLELRKSSRKGILVNVTTAFFGNGKENENVFGMNENTSDTDVEHKSNNSNNDDLISLIISKGKSPNKDLSVSSSLLISCIVKTSSLSQALTILNISKYKKSSIIPLKSVENSGNISVAADIKPDITDLTKNTTEQNDNNNLEVQSDREIYFENVNDESTDKSDNDSLEQKDETLNQTKSLKEYNYVNLNNVNSIKNWENVEFEPIDEYLMRLCIVIFEGDKKEFENIFNTEKKIDAPNFEFLESVSTESGNVSISNKSKNDIELETENAIEDKIENDIKNEKIKEISVDHDKKFFSKYTDIACGVIIGKLSVCLSSLLYLDDGNDCDDVADDTKCDELSTKSSNGEAKIEKNEDRDCGIVSHKTDEADVSDNRAYEHSRISRASTNSRQAVNIRESLVLDFVLQKLSVFLNLKYEEQISLTGLVRHCILSLCAFLVQKSYKNSSENRSTKKCDMNCDENNEIKLNESLDNSNSTFRMSPSEKKNEKDILQFLVNVLELTSSIKKELKIPLDGIFEHARKIKMIEDTLCVSVANIDITDIKKSMRNNNSSFDKNDKNDKNDSEEIKNNTVIGREYLLSHICSESNSTPLQSKQNKKILLSAVIINEFLKETVGAIFATKKMKFSVFNAHKFSKSVNMSGENTKFSDGFLKENWEEESDLDEKKFSDSATVQMDSFNDENLTDNCMDDFSESDITENTKLREYENASVLKILTNFGEERYSADFLKSTSPYAKSKNSFDSNINESDFLSEYYSLEKELSDLNT